MCSLHVRWIKGKKLADGDAAVALTALVPPSFAALEARRTARGVRAILTGAGGETRIAWDSNSPSGVREVWEQRGPAAAAALCAAAVDRAVGEAAN